MGKPTQMQRTFKQEMIVPIIKILFPDLVDLADQFRCTFGWKYTWVTIDAKLSPTYIGIDTRTNKERRQRVPDPRECLNEGFHLDFAIDNHSQSEYKLLGKISRKYMENNFDVVCFRMWNFGYEGAKNYGAGKKFSDEQQAEVVKYLNSVGIGRPSLDEFYNRYYED